MRYAPLCLTAAVLIVTGCRDKQADATPRVPSAPAPMPKQESAALPPENAAPPAEAVVSKPMIVAGPVPHALQPVQDGIEAFKSKYGRLPFSLQEMVDMKVLLQVPPLPPNKMYVIDHETGQVRVTSNP